MKTLMTATALAALIASPAFAQSTDTPAQPPAVTEPAPGLTSPEAPSMNEPLPGMTTPDTSAPGAALPGAMSSPDTAAIGSDLFITEQAPDDHLVSALIGTSVKSGANEDLGTINDIVLSDAGQIDAVVVGVGGFLGIGEKNVAVGYKALQKTTDADGNVILSINATREQLEAAPAFVTVAEARKEMNTPATTEPAPPPTAQ